MSETLYLIDGHYQMFRAFYAPFRDLSSPTGEPTKATHVFCQMLLGLLRDRKPDYLAVVVDVSDETVFRRDIDPEYKAHREPAPEDFEVQFNRVVQIVERVGIPIFRVPGYEADDVTATIAERLRDRDVICYLVSRDKDLDQLLTDRVHIFDPTKDEVVTPESLVTSKGYAPEKAVEIQTLTGDSTDNVPGVKGIGPKTAVKLIEKYGTAAEVVRHAAEQTPKMRENLEAFADRLDTVRKLVTLRRDVPVTFELERCRTGAFDLGAALPLFEELGFKTLRQNWAQLAAVAGGGAEGAATATGSGGAVKDRASAAPPGGGLLFPLEAAPSDVPSRYELVDTPEALEAMCAELRRAGRFAFDTETTGLNPVHAKLVGASFATAAGRAWYVAVRSSAGRTLPEALVVEKLRPLLEDPAIPKVGQNLKYDMLMLRQTGIRVRGELFDTMLASFLLEPLRSSHGLDALAQGLLGHRMIPITNLIGSGRNQISMDHVETPRICEYAAEDADYTWRLGELFEKKLAESPVERLFRETEMPLVEVLTEMEHNGVAIDEQRLADLGTGMEADLERLRQQVYDHVGHPFNLDSTRQLGEVLYDELKLPVIKKTKTGRSTDAESLEGILEQVDHPVPKLLLEYREIFKLKSTYVDTLPKMVSRRTGRIHASYHQAGAVTGRLSSSDPNLQNIPIRTSLGRKIREAFVAGSPETVLLAADYSQVELRLLAHFCKDEALLEAFQRGEDIHRFVASQVHDVPIERVTPEQRSAAKAVNFGIIYGQTAFGLSRGLGISQTEAKAFIDRYFRRYPGIRAFIDQCVASARRNGYAETILGRRRPIRELESQNRQQASFGERIAVNTVVQGSAADLIKRAMVDIHRELEGSRVASAAATRSASRLEAYTARMLMQVHDELVFEVAEASVEREARMIREKMTNAIPLDVPIVVDLGWAKNWLAAK
ncbi:MAG: DNA polymerase I [Phycisphaerae bacterium]|nr:DNA polymerase I [Phycisphaerae bacterium]